MFNRRGVLVCEEGKHSGDGWWHVMKVFNTVDQYTLKW